MAALFKIGDTDYTRHILVPGYTINRIASYSEWTDGYGTIHRDITRYQVGGDITMCFRTQTDYTAFVETVRDAMQSTGYVTCTLYINNENQVRTVNCYLDMAPSNLLPLVGRTFDTITVTVSER